MPESYEIDEKKFCDLLKLKFDGSDLWPRALSVFRGYGRLLSWDVTNVLLYAVDQGKAEEILEVLENHYNDSLQYQHPDIRGRVCDLFGVNHTEEMFLDIVHKTLGLD